MGEKDISSETLTVVVPEQEGTRQGERSQEEVHFPGGQEGPRSSLNSKESKQTQVLKFLRKEGDGLCLIIQGWLELRALLAEGAESPLDPAEELQKLLLHLSGAAARLEIRLPVISAEFPPRKIVFAMNTWILLVLSGS